MVMPRIDHHGYSVRTRDDLIEGVVYKGLALEYILAHFRPGDRLRLQREGKSYPQIEVEVIKSYGDYAEVTDGNKEYDLWASWEYNYDSWPWLRHDGSSAGEVSRVTLLELSDHE